MPNAAFVALTAPLLIGEVPDMAMAPEPHVAVIDLNWSLALQDDDSSPLEQPPGSEDPASDADQVDENQIVVEGEYGPSESDPVEAFNAESYRITQELDEVFVEPMAYAYRDGLPSPLRDGLGNVVRNLGEPNNALNFLLQGKVGKSIETLGRLLINSTLGFGGLIDMAEKPGIGLPYRRNGFGNTLGFYGVGPGPYLYLPVTGATTGRDLIGSGLDQLLLPVAVGAPFNQLEFGVPYFIVNSLDSRLEVDEELKRIEDTIDPYAARRDTYLYRREREIAELRGEEPPPPPAILEEVEGTGEFADPPEQDGGEDSTAASDPLAAYGLTKRPVLAITRSR